MFAIFQKLLSFVRVKRKKNKIYELMDIFGCPECPPRDCPTYLIRNVHKKFQNALRSYNIIVVYGESRQGKTWTIEKYCPSQLRIGCTASMTVEQIKKEMLHIIGIDVRKVEHTICNEYTEGVGSTTNVGNELMIAAGVNATSSSAHKETMSTSYDTVNMEQNAEFIEAVKSGSQGKYYVLDNFHYLSPKVQKEFCTLLKEFNYQNIKVIIVGVWKDASKITALAPDLVNRCEHIDIGSWTSEELDEVVKKGEDALNIRLDSEAISFYERCCANNIGIFKDFLHKYCQEFGVYETQTTKKELIDSSSADKIAKEIIYEAFTPLHDRIVNLALPQREKKDSKHMRQKIVVAILQIIVNDEIGVTQNGISLSLIKETVDNLCVELNEDKIGISNLTQELGVIHLREENRQTGLNFISLFHFDKVNKKLLVLEPTIYEIKAYSNGLLTDIIEELKESLLAYAQ